MPGEPLVPFRAVVLHLCGVTDPSCISPLKKIADGHSDQDRPRGESYRLRSGGPRVAIPALLSLPSCCGRSALSM